jgi:pimeloyl-ACP methyl ester carboxylesterase
MKFFFQIIGLVAACYCLIGAALYFFQEKMLFFPMGQPFGDCAVMDRYRAKAVNREGVRYYLKKSDTARAWIVVFHGNAGNACDRTYFFDLLSGVDVHIALFEYPGYGGDNKKTGEAVIKEQTLAAVLQIKKADAGHLPVFLLGESLGTGVATWVSAQTDIAGLILISAYTSIANVAQHHYPWLPVKVLLKHKFAAEHWAKQTRSPAILFHGKDDDIIPIKFAREQVENFQARARLFEVENCGHNDIVDAGGNVIKEQIKLFLSPRQ